MTLEGTEVAFALSSFCMTRSVAYVGAAAPGVRGVSLGKGKVILSGVVDMIAMRKERRERSVKKERLFRSSWKPSYALRFLECR